MQLILTSIFTAPNFKDDGQTQSARQLYAILWTWLIAISITLLAEMVLAPQNFMRWVFEFIFFNSFSLFLIWLTHSGHTRWASRLLMVEAWAIATGMAFTGGGLVSRAAWGYYILVFVAGILLGARAGMIMAAVCSLTTLGMAYLGTNGRLPPNPLSPSLYEFWMVNTLYLVIVICLQYLATRSIQQSLARAQKELAERLQAEAELRQEKQLSDQIINFLPATFCMYDEQLRPVRWNKFLLDESGYTNAEMAQVSALDFFPPEHRAEALELIRRVFSDGWIQIEAEVVDKNGGYAPYMFNGASVQLSGQPYFISLGQNISESRRIQQQIQALNDDLLLAYEATIEGWANTLELRDRETEGHARRVVKLTLDLARRIGITEADLIQMRRGAILHDIGKMGVPDNILLKPGRLNDEEWEIMRQHPTYAHRLLGGIPFLRSALEIPYCHHEKWDGSGYPRGLKGEEIPLSARIFAVIDVWDALCTDRPYRPAWPTADVIRYLKDNVGSHFDPSVVPTFLEMITESQD